MKQATRLTATFRAQRGLALVFVLLMMVIAMSAALFSARQVLMGDKASRNDRDRQIAFQAAEMALNDAELDIMDAGLALESGSNARGCKFGNPEVDFYPSADCSANSKSRGFCSLPNSDAGDAPIYKRINWDEADDSKRVYVKYGEFTGRSDALTTGTGKSPVPAQPPKYIVVQAAPAKLQILRGGITLEVAAAYKVYALGYGTNSNTQVMLESEIYKPMIEKSCNAT